MKRKDFTDLKGKSVKDLKKLALAKKAEVSKKLMEVASGKDKNLKTVRNLRRDIAQIWTLVAEKEIVESMTTKETKGETK